MLQRVEDATVLLPVSAKTQLMPPRLLRERCALEVVAGVGAPHAAAARADERRMTTMRTRPRCAVLLVCLALGFGLALVGGCHGGVVSANGPLTCSGPQLAPCARALQAAGEAADATALRERAAKYAALAREHDQGDPWAQLFAALQRQRSTLPSDGPATVIVAELAVAPQVLAAAARARVAVVVQDLKEPASLPAAELLTWLAAAARFDHVLWVRGQAAWQLFPLDPLQPFMAGLAPVVRDDAALTHLTETVALAQTLRAAFSAASGFHYVEAAALADRLVAQAGREATPDEPVLRARYGLQLLRAAGIVLSRAGAGDSTPDLTFSASPADTPYGDLLRVRLATSKARTDEWTARRTNILRGIAADRRDDFADLMAPAPACRSQRLLPMESVRDLAFSQRLADTLAPEGATPAAGQLPLRQWQQRYDTLVELVSATGSAWSYLPALLRQRGPAPISPSPPGRTQARVTELALAHLHASQELQQAAPARYQVLSQFELLLCAGLRADPPLFREMLFLSDASVKSRLAPPASPAAVLEGVLWAALAGLGYPDAARASYFNGLHAVLSSRLGGDLQSQTGWAVAGLYALDELYRRLTGAPSQLATDTHHLVRALADPGVAYPELAGLVQAAALYLGLVLDNALDAALVGNPAGFPSQRLEAYQLLQRALQTLGTSDAAAAASSEARDLAAVADGLFTVLAAAVHSKPGWEPQCKDEAAAQSPQLRTALDKLRALRLQLIGPAISPTTATSGQLRTRLLLQILSDLLDYGARDGQPIRFATASDAAERNVRDGLRTWPLGTGAALLGQSYRLLRDYLAQAAELRKVPLSPAQTQALLAQIQELVRAAARAGTGSQLVAALSQLDFSKLRSDNLAQAAAGLAQGLYLHEQPQQAGILLLTAALLDSGDAAATRAVLAAAERQDRPLVAMVRFLLDSQSHLQGRAPAPSAYAAALRSDAESVCQESGTAQVLTLLQAASDFSHGKRGRARSSLRAWLQDAEEHGLSVPRVTYQFEEKVGTLTFQLGYSLSYGLGVLNAGKDFKLGLGASTTPHSESKLTTSFASHDNDKANQEATRYYVYGAALLAVYELLDGHTAAAEQAAARALIGSEGRTRLGRRPLPAGNVNLAHDSRAVFAVAAQLLAEAGRPILAGRLWAKVYGGFFDHDDEATVLSILSPLPTGLAGVAAVPPLLPRVQASLRQLARDLPCRRRGQPPLAAKGVTCAEYPLALALSLGGDGEPLPGFPTRPQTACENWQALDRFMRVQRERQASRPARAAAITAAVSALLAARDEVGAALLLLPLPSCDAELLTAAQRVAAAGVPPPLQQQLLSEVTSCTPRSTPAQ